METPYKPPNFEVKEAVENSPNPDTTAEKEYSNKSSELPETGGMKPIDSGLQSPEPSSNSQTISEINERTVIEPIKSVPEKMTPSDLEDTILEIMEQNNQKE